MSGNRAGRTVTLLILFLVVVVAVVVIFLYVEGISPTGPGSSSGPTSFSFSGTFAMNTGGGSGGVFVFDLKDIAGTPIVSFTFSCPLVSFNQANCDGLTANAPTNSAPVTAANPLLAGDTAIASGSISAATGTVFTAGHIYDVTITATLSNGQTSSITEQLAAQG